MIFRSAQPQELAEIARLVGHSFIGRAQEELEQILGQGGHGGVEALWVGEEEGRVTSACQLLSLRQWIGGVEVPLMGLGSVAVSPLRRKQGVAARLIAAGLRHAHERGDLASALYPFRISFYERLGYGLAGEAYQYRVPPECFRSSRDGLRTELVESAADHPAVREVYDRWARTQTGQLVRGEGAWRKVWEGEGKTGVLFRGESGEPEGYAIVRYRADLPPQERFLDVEERAWLTPAAQRSLYGWLGTLGDQWQQILYRAHPEEEFLAYLNEPRLPIGSAPLWGLWFPAATLMLGTMFRLVNVAAAWEARPIAEGITLPIAVEVRDEQLPENRGPWRLRFEGGRIAVEHAGRGTVDATLALSVSNLSRIYIGALTPSAAVATGLATIDHPGVLPQLDAALRLPRPWTFDRF